MASWIKNYDLVPLYAQYDYEKYLSQDIDSPMIVLARMSAEMNVDKMKKALGEMAKPCVCDKF